MKKPTKHIINYSMFIMALVAVIVSGCRCATIKPDPLVGFHWSSLGNLDSNKAITDDYKNYIQTLKPNERQSPSVHFYEDGTGQHAVEIIIGVNGRWWRHILIYDKDDKRIKTIKYATGYYAS